ncbi:MAG: DNA cytosine methyltransferase [Aeropyrum sp.]|nr:DNA cytosine methyltransferase [Aeropyrum sp.]MCE4616705.1 DNA cytosine methyltransferase [Aeropyrum sp.]
MSRGFTVVDLFSGGGGFGRGFEEAGFKVLAAVDNYPPAAKTYKYNFPHASVIADDIKEIGLEEILEAAGLRPGEVDVVVASPPCEPFTGANPRRMERPLDRLYRDPAGQLFLHAIRVIGSIKPRYFVVENVPGIMHPEIERSLRAEVARAGYPRVYFNVLKAEDHGTPSRRTRVFISNVRLNPRRVRGPTVAEALKGLPEPGASWPPNHEDPPEVPRRHRRRLARLRSGRGLIEFTGAGGRRIPNYVRLDPHRHAPTVMGTSRFVHPFQDRLLTVREQARLMGFPDYHVFLGSRDAQYNMVGEAVPPPLASAIAEYLASLLEDGGATL